MTATTQESAPQTGVQSFDFTLRVSVDLDTDETFRGFDAAERQRNAAKLIVAYNQLAASKVDGRISSTIELVGIDPDVEAEVLEELEQMKQLIRALQAAAGQDR